MNPIDLGLQPQELFEVVKICKTYSFLNTALEENLAESESTTVFSESKW